MKRVAVQMLVGILIFVAFSFLGWRVAHAAEPVQIIDREQDKGEDLDCRECHWDIQMDWEKSAHGEGISCGQCHLGEQDNHARAGHWTQGGVQQCMMCHTTGYDPATDTWDENNIHCKACHQSISPNHPDEPNSTDRSGTLCGQCHIQAFFEWQESVHGLAGVVCVSCHNQHSTSLKSTDVIEQCESCHEGFVGSYDGSVHSQQGVTCGDCHLASSDSPVGEGSAKRNHTFSVELRTCIGCHDQLHTSIGTSITTGVNLPIGGNAENSGTMESMTSTSNMVNELPGEVNTSGYLALLGVVSVGLGIVTLPWTTRLIGRISARKRGA